MEQLLPLGTIVKVNLGKGNTPWLMIAGYYPRNAGTGKVYDYLTVLYPFGMSYKVSVQMIRKSAIMKVEAYGYMDEEAEAFTRGLPELLEKSKDIMLAEFRSAAREAVVEEIAAEEDAAVESFAEGSAVETAREDGVAVQVNGVAVDPNEEFG